MAFPLPAADLPPDVAALLPGGCAADLAAAMAAAWAEAPFLKGLMRGRPATLARLATAGPQAALADALALAGDAAQPIMPRLRAARRDVALITALADLAGLWSLEQVTAALSDFTDLAIDAAIAAALAERGAANQGLVALALGKLGSRELNYSSDADLIFIHDPAAIPCRGSEDPGEAAVRIARRAVAILNDLTPDGYVARIDLRLRPSAEITPMSISVAAAEHYYQSEALTWERVAFIRARAVGGDIALGRAFLEQIRPFVWRRSLDYTAVRDIQSVSLRIRDHFEGGQAIGPGYDLKRGRGGIREVEFFAQINQLIWGGRDPALRAPATLDGLAALATAGHVSAAEAASLADAYRALRTLEHRLQMRRDEQTHAIPRLAADRHAVARLCGLKDGAALTSQIDRITRPVAAAYDRLIRAATPEATPVPADPRAWLKANHPGLAKLLPPLIASWRQGKYRALKSEAARGDFEIILPALIERLAAAADPREAATRLDGLLGSLPAGAQFMALLRANPRLVTLLGNLIGITPVLAGALARDPALFDVMLAPDAFAPLPDAHALAADLASLCRGADGVEEHLDRVRHWTAERRFQLGAQLIEGHGDALVVGRSLADLADAAISLLLPVVAADFARAHGHVPGGELIVLALGRHGGRAMTHASDLDLVFLFSGDHETLSDGAKPLPASQYFNRLAARLVTALSVPTAAGALYEVDTRLRPWGAKGNLALSLASFARYQRDEAESWEHMALTRARVVAGPAAAAQAVIADVLTRPRAEAALRSAVLAMRADMAAAKKQQGRFDVKLASGGLVDLEFIVHFRQLASGRGLHPELPAALAALIADGQLPADLLAAHDLLARTLIWLRLLFAGAKVPDALPEPVAAILARALGAANFAALTAQLALAREQVRVAWAAVFNTGDAP
ncbi:bifunctional glutamine synthetase adenylyltransferase/deadenyltransferase [Sandarakinorhabdus cyanobacteriorum]|uniref:Bifunctional glutamine synthetase adenylyltransferase/deadenyltransferase n=1 Tax=Sandarakinorhabdus cyanobacteriorum TaxID=1981098 RepID=A0A255YP56_9SPHN|nr:bifunctional [glutamine synthetase] adenylyltransferase/[glutamine synthetase]-adenylyl-L-tyrosine phosphorylase [Sandarakinorhabdus cyanobacteriorum]OYQ31006.1 bifunctional glutamine synthetase adenylyltransferase/deadenyltransferase [Sandarakinorhabdus cyanobacteriorum]